MIHGCHIGAGSVVEPGAIVCDGSVVGAGVRRARRRRSSSSAPGSATASRSTASPAVEIGHIATPATTAVGAPARRPSFACQRQGIPVSMTTRRARRRSHSCERTAAANRASDGRAPTRRRRARRGRRRRHRADAVRPPPQRPRRLHGDDAAHVRRTEGLGAHLTRGRRPLRPRRQWGGVDRPHDHHVRRCSTGTARPARRDRRAHTGDPRGSRGTPITTRVQTTDPTKPESKADA